MLSRELEVTSEIFWQSTILFAVLDALLILLLLWLIKPTRFAGFKWSIVAASSAFWGIFGTALVWGFWDSYYRHFAPDPVRWIAPGSAVLYGAIGLALYSLALRTPSHPIVTFCVLGALEGLLEHLRGVYAFGIPDKIPMLQNASVLSILAFSLFEYVLYWGIVLGIAILIEAAWRHAKLRRTHPTVA